MSSARKWKPVEVVAARPERGVTSVGPAPIENEILTAREARQLLKIGRTKLWELTRHNEIPAYRVGSDNRASLRYKRDELLAWLEGNRVNGVEL